VPPYVDPSSSPTWVLAVLILALTCSVTGMVWLIVSAAKHGGSTPVEFVVRFRPFPMISIRWQPPRDPDPPST
jgi:hypothetical protein